MASFDLQVGRLLASLKADGRTLVMITADHGHVDAVPDEAIQFEDHPELLAMLRVPPAGERRAVYLHPVAGGTLEVAEYARERMRGVAVPMLRDDAVQLGLFGPGQLSERAAGRIGEVILFPRGSLQLVAKTEMIDGSIPRVPIFRGLHGGMTPEEALVPLLAVRV